MIRFDGVLTIKKDVISEAEACRRVARRLFGVEIPEAEQPVFGIENLKPIDIAQAEEHGKMCRIVSRGCKSDDGVTAYTEPCFMPADERGATDGVFIFVDADGILTDESRLLDEDDTDCVSCPKTECDNSIDIHPYYIRTKYSKGIWLDVVTEERWGDGVLTMPVSVKAMHNWAEHAVREDPELFFAAVF